MGTFVPKFKGNFLKNGEIKKLKLRAHASKITAFIRYGYTVYFVQFSVGEVCTSVPFFELLEFRSMQLK